MLENKKDKTNEIHYSRYIISWIHSGKTCFGSRFKKWLQDLGLSENDIHDIMDMAMMGKLELEKSAKQY